MELTDICICAATHTMPKEALNPAEWTLFYRLRDIYDEYKHGDFDNTIGIVKKNTALAQFDKDKSIYEFSQKVLSEHAAMWDNINKAATAYCQNPSIEAADELYKAVYSAERKKEANDNN